MAEEERGLGEGPTEGARRGTGVGPLGPQERWSTNRKREVILRLLRGESMDALSRELGVEIYRLEQWRDKALHGIDASLRERGVDRLQRELDAAKKHIGELTMKVEILEMAVGKRPVPFGKGRSRR